ncbi:MAG: hypothetical protein KGL74_05980, partial [Elusimicrobia bacterium]|nr:hypothetical protein [Elusimicrobiota bacterium]
AAADFGVLFPARFDGRLKTALTASNIGGKLTYEQTPEVLPQTVRFGSSFLITPRWVVSADMAVPLKENYYAAAGTEYWLPTAGPWRLACRAGFNSQTLGSVDGFTGAALGFGLGFTGTTFDYAFVPYGGLGQAHRVSVTYAF